MPISGTLEIHLPLIQNEAIDIEHLLNIEIVILVNGEQKLSYRRGLSTTSNHLEWHYINTSPNIIFCPITAVQTEAWRGLVQAYVKFVGTDCVTGDYSETQYLPITLFVARKGFEARNLAE